LTRGFGTRAASRVMKSIGSKRQRWSRCGRIDNCEALCESCDLIVRRMMV